MVKKNRKRKSKKIIRNVFIIIIILIIILLILITAQTNFSDRIKRLFNEPELIVIDDECAIIMGNLLHQIKNDGDCQISCFNECKLKGLESDSYEFILSEDSCHTCNCYCK